MFGNRLKEIRNEKKLSQAKLAEMLNVSQQTIGSWEVNRTSPPPETITQIADILQTTTDYILGKSNIPDPIPPDSVELLKQIEQLKAQLSKEKAEKAEKDIIIATQAKKLNIIQDALDKDIQIEQYLKKPDTSQLAFS